mmetsp:Transcript_18726/g.43864  ORF Transcript_18726/g.43864 Transcript_18726/m.43864 type:complete len:766 (-) Transcript_18726:1351-3648(-)
MMAHQIYAHNFNDGVDPSRSDSHQELHENYLASLQGSGDENDATAQQSQVVQPMIYVGNNTLGNAGALGGFLLNPLASIFGISETNNTVVPAADPARTVFQGRQQTIHDQQSIPSPTSLVFMTPNQGPTPSTTPETFMTPRHGPTPSSLALSGAAHTAIFGDSSPKDNQHSKKETSHQDESYQVTSDLQGGIASSVVGSLGSMASYIKSSFSAGIPFHSADKAMTSMKSLNKRWWEGGIAGNKRRRGDECSDDEDGCQPGSATKRRKSNGSKLSIKLMKNYEEMGVDQKASGGVAEGRSGQKPSEWTVDTTIVNSRRLNSSGSDLCGSDQGYNAFNNVDAMYKPESNVTSHDAASGHFQEDAVYSSPTSTYYTTREYEETASIVSNSTTITNTFVNDTMQSIHDMLDERNQRDDENELLGVISNPRDWVKKTIRSEMMAGLEEAQGDVCDQRFNASLEVLLRFYKSSGRDARISPWAAASEISGGPGEFDLLEGSYLNLSRPAYVESIGFNKENEYLYNLGRMSFDMFMPREIICSVQKTFSTIKVIGEKDDLPNLVPASLREEVDALSASLGDSSRAILRSYNIDVEMTIEPPSSVGMAEIKGTPSPKKRIRAVLSVEGYILPDPEVPNRLTVWFTGGRLAPSDDRQDDKDDCSGPNLDDEYGGFGDWSNIFSKGKWRRTLSEKARSVAARLVLGAKVPDKMEENGSMAYTLTRPVGGHGKVYLDVLYLDEDTLVMRGHHGTMYAMVRSNNIQRFRSKGIADKQ